MSSELTMAIEACVAVFVANVATTVLLCRSRTKAEALQFLIIDGAVLSAVAGLIWMWSGT